MRESNSDREGVRMAREIAAQNEFFHLATMLNAHWVVFHAR